MDSLSIIFLSQEKFKRSRHCCCSAFRMIPVFCLQHLSGLSAFLSFGNKEVALAIPLIPHLSSHLSRSDDTEGRKLSSGEGKGMILFSLYLKEMDNKRCSVM